MYETLKHYEEEVEEILAEQKKRDKQIFEPVVLVADKKVSTSRGRSSSRSKESVVIDSEKCEDNESNSDEDGMRRAMIMLINVF